MSATGPNDLIGSLRDLMSATTRADCVVRIEGHLERLYREYEPVLVLDSRALAPIRVTTRSETRPLSWRHAAAT